jgi:Protein of unknown function (DUF3558)
MNTPRNRAVSITVSAVLTLAAVSGCALPTRSSSPPAGESSAAPTAPGKTFPPRPREVRLNGIDPCTLITPQLRKEMYNLADDGTHERMYDALISSNCSLLTYGDPTYFFGVRLVTSQGADHYLRSAKTQVINVDGFGALDQPGLNDLTGNAICLVMVDVAPGQSLWVSFGTLDPPPPGYQKMCTKANAAAASIMQQLLAKAS